MQCGCSKSQYKKSLLRDEATDWMITMVLLGVGFCWLVVSFGFDFSMNLNPRYLHIDGFTMPNVSDCIHSLQRCSTLIGHLNRITFFNLYMAQRKHD